MPFDSTTSWVRKEKEPGPIRLLASLIYIHSVMIPSIWIYKRLTGSKEEEMQQAQPNANDTYRPSMQGQRRAQ
ncbi:MAG: hypothetical protein MI742_09780 [Desulfobacterales bacterium]|nr:hypothetical protein [Desulfobacterales bacterium]